MKNKYTSQLIVPAVFACAFLLSSTASAQVPQYVRTSGLKAYYSFDGNTEDATNNNLDLQNLGCSPTTDRAGNSNSAYSFDGSATYMRRANFPQPGTKDLVFSIWYKRNSSGVGGPIINYGDSYNQPRSCWITADPTILYSFSLNGLGDPNSIIAGADNGDASWHHAVFVRNDNDFYLYLDGVLQPGSSNSSQVWGAQYDLNIGSIATASYFNGKIDDVGIWVDHGNNFSACDVMRLYRAYTYTDPQNATAYYNGTATFQTTPSSNMTFQWQADAGTGFQNLTSAGQYSGTNTAMLTVSNLTQSNNNTLYRCVINNGVCDDITEAATLTVLANVGIQEVANTLAASIFPNPTNGSLTIETTLEETGYVQTTVRNHVGQTVYSAYEKNQVGDYRKNIEVDLPSGIYYLSLETDKGRATKKIEVIK